MPDVHERTDRFEMIASCGEGELIDLADAILRTDPSFAVLQEPTPQLILGQAREPIEQEPFNVGEVVVTTAEVSIDDVRGFAMQPGQTKRGAMAGAIVDSAVEGDHPQTETIRPVLESVAEREREDRAEIKNEREATAIEFTSIEDEL